MKSKSRRRLRRHVNAQPQPNWRRARARPRMCMCRPQAHSHPHQPQHGAPLRQIEGAGDGAPRCRGGDLETRTTLAYAAALKAAGVNTLLREYGDLNHGFFSFTAISKASEAASDQLCDDLLAIMKA